MLRGLLLTPKNELARRVEERCAETHQVVLLESLDSYLDEEGLRRFVRAHSPQVIFIDLESSIESAARLIRHAQKATPRVALVGLLTDPHPERILAATREGIREILYAPFAADPFRDTLERVEEQLNRVPVDAEASEFVYSFFPAKPGDGASILAANTALHLARLPENPVLYADLDLSPGMSRFLLKLQNGFSAADALERFPEMDDTMWADIVVELGPLAVLGSGEIRKSLPHPAARVRHFIDFARRRYRMLVMDLDGRFDELALEAIAESRRSFLVMTPDLASVYLAREKMRFLRAHDLEDRVSVVLNRWHKDAPINISGIEEVLGVPIQQTLPDDRAALVNAVMEGGEVAPATLLGKELVKLAYALADSRPLIKVEPAKRKVEYFSIVPSKYTLVPGR